MPLTPKDIRGLGRAVAFFPELKKLTKSTVATILLCQLFYWNDKKSPDGWIYKTALDWEAETGLTTQEQRTARSILKELGILEEKFDNLDHRMFYKMNDDVFTAKWAELNGEEISPVSEKVKQELESVTPVRQSNTPKRGDRVDFELMLFPAAKKKQRLEVIQSHVEQQFNIIASSKRWQTFIAFALERLDNNGEDVRTFTNWAIHHPDFNPIYWTPDKCMELWKQAFVEEKPFIKPVKKEKEEEPQKEVLAQAPDRFFEE